MQNEQKTTGALFRQFGTNKQAETEGVVLEYGTASNGKKISIRVARAGGSNTKFAKMAEHKLKPMRRQIQNETADKEDVDRAMREVYADAVILGWENVENEHGELLEFTRENVLYILEALPELWKDILKASESIALFRQEIREADAGN